MYADNAQISHRQLFRQMVTGLLGIYVLVIPVLPEISGRQGILALLTAMGLYLVLCTGFVRLKPVFQSPEKYMGKKAGKMFILLYLSWLWLMGVYLLLVIVNLTQRFLVEGSRAWMIILLAGGAAYLGSHQGLERRGRMAEVSFPFVVLILAGMFFLGIFRMKPEYLREAGSLTLEGWMLGTGEILAAFLPLVFLPVTLGNVQKPGETRRVLAGGIVLLTGLLLAVLVLLQGSFGIGGYEHKDYPMVDFMAGIRIPGDFLERVDVFWVAAVMFSIFFSLGSVFFYQHELLQRIQMEKIAFFTSAGILAAAIWCDYKKISVQWFLDITGRYYTPLFAILLLFAGAVVHKKRTWKKVGMFCLLLVLATGMAGCGVSLENRVFPLSLSADYREGNYRLIYGIPKLTQMTGQKKEETEESQPQAIVYEGKTPEEAEKNFDKNQKNYLDMGHIKTLILGQSLLQETENLERFLDYLEKKPSVAGNIYVFVCSDPEELMSLDGQGEESVGDYLTGILENHREGNSKDAVTLQDLYNARHRKEKLPKLPTVTVLNKKPQISQYS